MKSISCLVVFASGALRGALGFGLRKSAMADHMLLQQGLPNEQPLQKAANLEKGLLHVLESKTRGGAAVGSSLRSDDDDLVELVKEFIGKMEAAINVSHAASQEIVNNLTSSFTSCATTKSVGDSEAATLLTEQGTKRTAHESCRSIESSKKTQYDDCMSDLNTLEGAMTAVCDAYEAAKKTPSIDLVPKPVSGQEYKPWLEVVRDWAIEELASLSTRESQCSNNTAAYNNKKAVCEGSGGAGGLGKEYTDQEDQCDLSQAAFESTTCSYADKVEAVCETYSACYDSSQGQWDAQIPNIQTEEKSRQDEWWILQRIRCFLDVLAAADGGTVDSAQMEACKDAAHSTDFLNLSYPALPQKVSCPGVTEKPCTDGFLQTEYSSLPGNAPATQCTACAQAGTAA